MVSGIFCVDVKYIDAWSLFIFSTTGIQPSSDELGFCPLRSIVIGSPFSPLNDQLFLMVESDLAVFPKRIELPNLPSSILSPAKDNKG